MNLPCFSASSNLVVLDFLLDLALLEGFSFVILVAFGDLAFTSFTASSYSVSSSSMVTNIIDLFFFSLLVANLTNDLGWLAEFLIPEEGATLMA